MKVAITGNIGCGKSTVWGLLKTRLPEDFTFASVDELVRDLYDDEMYTAALEAQFGVSTKEAVSALVFSDGAKKRQLERLAEAFIKPKLEALLESPNVILEFPLLFESGAYYPAFNLTVAVTCGDDTQARRVISRDSIGFEKLAALRASQLSAATKSALADWTVDTEGSPEMLREQVDALAKVILEKAREECVSLDAEMEVRFMRSFNSAPLWQTIRNAYSENHRHYHVLAHPYAMLQHLDQLVGEGRNRRGRSLDRDQTRALRLFAIESAIWFHDLTYRVDSDYELNESDSAHRLFALVGEHCPWLLTVHRNGFYSDLALSAEMIMATKKHRAESAFLLRSEEAKASCELFLDLDLGILSASETEVDRFDNNIRKEFAMYSDADFAKGRATALQGLLECRQIYHSPYFADRESKARQNLSRLLARYTVE